MASPKVNTKYKYIEVKSPDRGIDKSKPATEIDPRSCSDCLNVYFENGVIKKRFGYGSPKQIIDAFGPLSTGHPFYSGGYDKEIADMAVHEHTLNAATPFKRAYAISIADGMYYKEASSVWYRMNNEGEYVYDYASGTLNDWKPELFWRNAGQSAPYFNGVGPNDFSANCCMMTSGHARVNITIDNASTIDSFEWSVGDGGAAIIKGTNITMSGGNLPYILSDSGKVYGYVNFDTSTSHTSSDNWSFERYTSGNTDATQIWAKGQASTAQVKVGAEAYNLNLSTTVTVNGPILSRRLSSQTSWENVDQVKFWLYSDVAFNAGDLSLRMFDDTATPYYGLIKTDWTAGIGAFISTPLSTISASTWEYHTLNLTGGKLGSTFSGTTRQAAIILNTGTAFNNKNIYLDGFQVSNSVSASTGLGADSTKTEATTHTTLTASVKGTTQSYLTVTNYCSTHYVRYMTNDLTTPRFLTLTGANDVTNGYNVSTGSDAHRAHAISGFNNRLHLLANQEELSAGNNYEMRIQDRWSDFLNADKWSTGTANTVFLADTNGRVINSAIIGGHQYVFKSDAIVRYAYIGGNTGLYDIKTVYQEDSLLTAKAIYVHGDYCYWAGKNNIYRFAGGNAMERIGDTINTELYSTAGFDYSNGQYYRRSHWMEVSPKNTSKKWLMLVVPTDSSYPDKGWLYDLEENTFTKWDFTRGASGSYPAAAKSITAGVSYEGLITVGTESTLQRGCQFGTSDGKFFEFDGDVFSDNGESIYGNWDSKDFARPDNIREFARWRGVHFEAKGLGTVSVQYSIDRGTTWVALESYNTLTLTTDYQWYFADFKDPSAQQIRIRFFNDTAGEWFEISRFALQYQEESAN